MNIDKLKELKDDDVIEMDKKQLQTLLETEKAKGLEQGKIEGQKQNIPIVKTRERNADDPNRIGKFLVDFGGKALFENRSASIEYAKDNNNKVVQRKSEIAENIIKSMSVSDYSQGGAYVPNDFASEVIPSLQNASVLRKAGIQVRPMPNGNLTIRKNTTGASSFWADELEAATPTDIKTGTHTMTAKKLTCFVNVSNTLLRFPDAMAFQQIQSEMIRSIAAKEDATFLFGTGTSAQPKGIRNWANASNINAQTGTPDTAKKIADLTKAITLVDGANIPVIKPYFIMDSRVKYNLAASLLANGSYALPSINNDNLWGIPILKTNSLMGASTSEVIYVDLGHVILGQTTNMSIEFLPNQAVNSSGYVVGAVTDESCFRIIMEEDLFVAYDKAISVITGVTWGV